MKLRLLLSPVGHTTLLLVGGVALAQGPTGQLHPQAAR
jgi:hypothetical protein